MERMLTKAELEAQLKAKEEDIQARVDALKGEVEGAGEDARRFVVTRPQMIAGGALVAGLLVGWYLTGRSRRRRERRMARSHNALVERYMHALSGVVHMELANGKDLDTAIHDAMRNHLPLIVVEPGAGEDRGSGGGIVREIFGFLLQTGLGFASRTLMDQIQARLHLDDQVSAFFESVASAPSADSFATDSPAQPIPAVRAE
jgi:hypothetical protein